MIEELIENLKSEVGGELTAQTELSSGDMDGLFSVIGDVLKNEGAKELLGGNMSSLTNLFSDNPNNEDADKLQTNITSGVVGEMIGKLGISPEQSKKIAAIVIPALISMVTKKTSSSSADDSSFLSELMGGGNKGGLGGLASGMLGSFLK